MKLKFPWQSWEKENENNKYPEPCFIVSDRLKEKPR